MGALHVSYELKAVNRIGIPQRLDESLRWDD